ncbi:putative rna polymerase ii mediator complex protein [Diplodia seriata]|uniref:Mediator of RNA polymerase II transcription subunit 7 n=1 Tax=Diplodia seriata TaxID=420778 RepID=A0A0G2GAH3_9PEZI|nr:putative rna polymerase ii mediator complex protein [Diplodia seriata]
MADLDNPDNVLSATFPAPPPFWKHFTSDNRARYKELQQQNDDQTAADEGEGRKPADIPAELRYLRPPEPPANGKYRSFGDPYDKMTQSLLLNYLELAGVLAADPGRWQEKYEDMQTLLFNAHHLINEYRPHQARASLIAMMEEQLARRREEVEGSRQHLRGGSGNPP